MGPHPCFHLVYVGNGVMTQFDIDSMSNDELREWVAELIVRLNELDEMHFFGPEGWRETLLGEFDGNH
jgi:hypothetical protein